MISIFLDDLANTIKTLPVSVGLNSHASNGQDPHMSRALENTCLRTNTKNTESGLLCAQHKIDFFFIL
jgi:hypothetical protein